MAATISFASGKGGVGKSVVSGNLGVLFARFGLRTVLADLDVGGADQHIMFGVLEPDHTLTDFQTRGIDCLEDALTKIESRPGLQLLAGTGDTLATANPPYSTKQRVIRAIRKLPADVVLIDVGAGKNFHTLDYFLMADLHVVVTNPEPAAVTNACTFIKLAAIRRVLTAFRARSEVAKHLSRHDFRSVEDALQAAGEIDDEALALARAAIDGFNPLLVVNRIHSGVSKTIALKLRKTLTEFVGRQLDVLGEIPDDPAVRQSLASFLPVVEGFPTSPAAVALEKLGHVLQERVGQSVSSFETTLASPLPPTEANSGIESNSR